MYRYRLKDRIRVVGRVGRTPLVEFVGRADGGSDLCGEKLTPGRVATVLAGLGPHEFAMLSPEVDPTRYVLWVEGPPPDAEALEARLREGHHYDRCRALGQLEPARVQPVRNGAAGYEAGCLARGMRAGEIKPTPLHPATDWDRWFES